MALLDPIHASAWRWDRARHLLNRAGFGVPHARIGALAKMSAADAVSSLVDYPKENPGFVAPGFLVKPLSYVERREILADMDEDARREWNQDMQRQEREAVNNLRAWWVAQMYHTPRPLEEKMALFWHGHFATSAQKVRESDHNYKLNQVFREHATGNFKALTIAVGQSPTMLRYLDNRQSTKRKPNENWARELMELFTMGEGQYTEEDIKESARAFTGWSSDWEKFVYNKNNHDPGVKTFLGRTGEFDGWDIIDIIMEQPVTAEFICGKLCAFFAYTDPEPELVKGLAKTFRDSGYELRPVLRQLFLSQAFYSERAMGTQIKSPTQYMVQLCADLGIAQPPYEYLANAASTLGQNLLHPPNVKGWDGNEDWINANTLLGRYNQPQRLALAVVQRDRKAADRARRGAQPEAKPQGDAMTMSAMTMSGPMRETGYSDEAGADPTAPWVASEKEVAARVEAQVTKKLQAMAPAVRRERQAAWRNASLAEKRDLLRELGISLPLEVPTPLTTAFREIRFRNGAECVDALARRFLATPIAPAQRAALIEALGVRDPQAPLRPADIPFENQNATVHLLTSMAEYQLC